MADKVTDNIDRETVRGFGEEWSHFDQSSLPPQEHQEQFDRYFKVFPWEKLPATSTGFDMGCGSGRWARKVAEHVGILHCVDASAPALEVTKRALKAFPQTQFHCASADHLPFEDNSQDFGYSLGVLHHIPDTQNALNSCVKKLKKGAPFLVYIYYAFDSKPWWFKAVWRLSDILRRGIYRLPFFLRRQVTNIIAALIYWPLARLSGIMAKLGLTVDNLPLSQYRHHSFYTMRTDALDRFGTKLEQRFTLAQIKSMMTAAGLKDLVHSPEAPFWCVCGIKE
ncbi:MAG: class I SAM-dependent methyltransferase [Alphaproteobacteria bacterium]|nr:class I SAM-dependent methyltransferase [Alphaproteobacteria bacterium]NCQ67047.1 class I SAM-dependent methyltransferase [Alphaproteobacteria bacterium]NCT07644.1 class I SAM-dependent methyltransferase [Alphaproteobacteria bacterium]